MADDNQNQPAAPAPAPDAPVPPAAPPVAVVPSEDLSGLRNALQSERSRADSSETQVKALKQVLLDTTTAQLLTGLDPQYQGLVAPLLRAQLTVNEQGQVLATDGKAAVDAAAQLRAQYPALFAAVPAAPVVPVPVGAGTTPSAAATPASTQVVSAQNGVVTGVSVDDLADGKVKVNLG